MDRLAGAAAAAAGKSDAAWLCDGDVSQHHCL